MWRRKRAKKKQETELASHTPKCTTYISKSNNYFVDRSAPCVLTTQPFVSACGSERRNKNHFAFYRYWDCLTGVQFMPILNFELDYLINLHKLNVVGADIRRLCVVYFVGFCGAKSKMIDIDYLTLGLHNSSHLDQFSIYLLRNK